jgi:hypothetical protein
MYAKALMQKGGKPFQETTLGLAWWFIPIFLAALEAEAEGLLFESSPGS